MLAGQARTQPNEDKMSILQRATGLCLIALSTALLLACAATNKPPATVDATQSIAPQGVTWTTVHTQLVCADGVHFAYRELGQNNGGTPVIFLVHLAAVLDNWDSRVVDGIAAKRHVVAFDNRGVGASTGNPANTIEQMADDAIMFIKAKGFEHVDLFGFSMGGMIAQEIVLKEPELVRRLILTGTGPAGGPGICTVAGVANYDLLRATFTGQDPKQYPFFTRTPNGIAAGKAFLQRLQERTDNRDKEVPWAPTWHSYRRCEHGGRSARPTCRWSSNRHLSPTAMTTAWSRRPTPTTWPGDCRTAS